MPRFARRCLAILAGIGFTLFIFALPLLEPRHSQSREQLPEHTRGPQPPLSGVVES